MAVVGALGSAALIAVVLADCFVTMVLPRRVTQAFRPARLFYRATWRVWSAVGRCLPAGRRRETFLSLFGPLSLLALFALWAASLIAGFALLHWSLGTPLRGDGERADVPTYLYMSGGTFFTLGYGDVTPAVQPTRLLAVAE